MSSPILLSFLIYQGTFEPALVQPPGNNRLQTESIAMIFVQPYFEIGHTSSIDNFYTAPRLAEYLVQRPMKVVGTIRSNGNGFPQDVPTDV